MAIPLGPSNVTGELAWQLDGLNRKLDAYVKAFHLGLADTAKKTAFRLEAAIKSRTPVDTGRARNSWHTVVWGGPIGYAYKDDHGKGFDGTLTSAVPRSPTQAIVGSNVVYMLALEAGHSQQAPSGMIRVSVAELRQHFADAVAALKARTKG